MIIVHRKTLRKINKDSTVIVTEPESADQLSGDIRIMKPGDAIDVNNIKIEAVAAYNTDKKCHPKEKNWLGIIVTLGASPIYHAGDTDLIEEMADLNVDIALLPVSGTYVMTADEAVEAAKRIKPKIAIPMHYDSLVGSEAEAKAFAKGLEGICEVKLIKPS